MSETMERSGREAAMPYTGAMPSVRLREKKEEKKGEYHEYRLSIKHVQNNKMKLRAVTKCNKNNGDSDHNNNNNDDDLQE